MKTFQDIINRLAPEVEKWKKEHAIKVQRKQEQIRTGKVKEDDKRKIIEFVAKESLFLQSLCDKKIKSIR